MPILISFSIEYVRLFFRTRFRILWEIISYFLQMYWRSHQIVEYLSCCLNSTCHQNTKRPRLLHQFLFTSSLSIITSSSFNSKVNSLILCLFVYWNIDIVKTAVKYKIAANNTFSKWNIKCGLYRRNRKSIANAKMQYVIIHGKNILLRTTFNSIPFTWNFTCFSLSSINVCNNQ